MARTNLWYMMTSQVDHGQCFKSAVELLEDYGGGRYNSSDTLVKVESLESKNIPNASSPFHLPENLYVIYYSVII